MKKKTNIVKEIKRNPALFVMLIPGLLVLLANNYLPMPGILLAFKDYNYLKRDFRPTL